MLKILQGFKDNRYYGKDIPQGEVFKYIGESGLRLKTDSGYVELNTGKHYLNGCFDNHNNYIIVEAILTTEGIKQ
jgi:hypothetical protein